MKQLTPGPLMTNLWYMALFDTCMINSMFPFYGFTSWTKRLRRLLSFLTLPPFSFFALVHFMLSSTRKASAAACPLVCKPWRRWKGKHHLGRRSGARNACFDADAAERPAAKRTRSRLAGVPRTTSRHARLPAMARHAGRVIHAAMLQCWPLLFCRLCAFPCGIF